MESEHSKVYWIDEFRIDPQGLRIIGTSGDISVEPKVMQVLSLLAEVPGETVLREMFKDRIWATDYGCDESLTRAISVLRKAFRKNGQRRAIIETVPRTGYRLVGTVSAIAPVTKPKDTSQTQTVPRPEGTLRSRINRYWPSVLASLVLIVGVASALTWQDQPSSEDRANVSRNMVQIVPFQAIGDHETVDRDAASLSSQMASTLAMQGIPTSFERRNMAVIPEFELAGDVLAQSDRLRATIRLKDFVTGIVIWSDTAEVEGMSELDLGFGLAIKTASILDCMQTWRSGNYPNAAETLQLYARFCEAYEMRSSKDFSALSEPIYRAETDNPMAVSLHGWALRNRAEHYGHLPSPEKETLLNEAQQLFERALQLDPDLPVAQIYYDLVTQADAGPEAYNSLLSGAAARNGLPEDLYGEYATLLRRTGRLHEAIWIYRRMAEFDATNPLTLARLGWMYAADGDFLQSERYFAQAEAIDPDSVELLMRRRQVELWLKGKDSLQRLLDNWPVNESIDSTQDEHCNKAYIRQVLSEQPDSDALLAACPEQDPMWTARMFIGMGDIDRAYAMTEGYDWERDPNYAIFFFYPDMQDFRRDARFWPLMDQLGLSGFWRETGEWPDFCRTEDHGSRCGSDS